MPNETDHPFIDRRHFERRKVKDKKVTLQVRKKEYPGKLQDISQNGLKISSEPFLPRQTKVTVTIPLAKFEENYIIEGKVKRNINSEPPEAGIKIIRVLQKPKNKSNPSE